ncbi:MAG: TlpA family protein disulfide reductase [Clostridia bacterium]
MRASWQRILTVLVLAAAAGYAGYILAPVVIPHQVRPSQAGSSAAKHVQVGLKVGDYPPNFTLEDVHGKTVTLWNLRGHAVWLNFWATWCPWCKTEMPDMQRIHALYGSKIDILGVDLQESQPTVVKWLQAHHISYDVLLDTTGGVATTYDVSKLPTSIFIGANGRITHVQIGALLSITSMKPFVNAAIAQ